MNFRSFAEIFFPYFDLQNEVGSSNHFAVSPWIDPSGKLLLLLFNKILILIALIFLFKNTVAISNV